jgi:hypothetical protein
MYVVVMLIALTQNEWDDNNDGVISWEEALDEFNKIFKSKINDKRDHWVSPSFIHVACCYCVCLLW